MSEHDDETYRPDGLTYGLLLVRATRDDVLRVLVRERFSGWVGPAQDGWVVAVADRPRGHVAARRRYLPDVGELVSGDLHAVVVTVVVARDLLLQVWAHDDGAEVVTYLSDAHLAFPDDEDAFGPQGAHGARTLAALAGRPDAGDELTTLLSDERGESDAESERLMAVCRLLGWPQWLVAVDSLPRRVPGGPDADAFTRLRAGRTGVGGLLAARGAAVVRRDE
ncbi:hypothetical protein LFM56_11740 [Cellulomonas iranensis]|uniref:hypothetical protein n=1 Tax=Cellulomonas iranensis TaxID=76862 RepID=UPI001CF46BA3|nr:hypothetical protein [Cellulomonas iranensis]UCN13576.1 hypothetical protein LFM56_11740 [Cellulomonas iranensis]